MICELRDVKDPDSSEYFGWDFRPMMLAGDTIASIVGIVFTETDGSATVDSAGAIDPVTGGIVSAKLGGCTKGRYYTARCRVLTTLTEQLDLSLRFYCDDV